VARGSDRLERFAVFSDFPSADCACSNKAQCRSFPAKQRRRYKPAELRNHLLKLREQFPLFVTIHRFQSDKLSQQLARVIGKSNQHPMVEIDSLRSDVRTPRNSQFLRKRGASSPIKFAKSVKPSLFQSAGAFAGALAARFWR